jgi:hypothetical protein
MDVMAGRAARRQPPLGDADFRRIDLNIRLGSDHGRSCPGLLQLIPKLAGIRDTLMFELRNQKAPATL